MFPLVIQLMWALIIIKTLVNNKPIIRLYKHVHLDIQTKHFINENYKKMPEVWIWFHVFAIKLVLNDKDDPVNSYLYIHKL